MSAPFPAPIAARILNALLAREPWARERLRPHAGKAARLAVGGLVLVLRIRPDGYVDAAAADGTTSAVSIRADAAMIGRLAVGGGLARAEHAVGAVPRDSASALVSALHIEGEAALAQVAAELARDLRWDGEEELARRIGDLPARLLTQAFATVVGAARDSANRLAQNAGEYVIHEARLLAHPAAVAEWRAGVRELDERARALEARVETALRNGNRA